MREPWGQRLGLGLGSEAGGRPELRSAGGARGISSRPGHEAVFTVGPAMLLEATRMNAKPLLAMLAEEVPQKIRRLGIGELVPRHILFAEIADIERFTAGLAAIVFDDTTKDDVDLADRGQAGYFIEQEFLRVDLYTGLFESLACSSVLEGFTPLYEPGRWSPFAQRGCMRSPTQQQTIAACQHQGNQDPRVLVTNGIARPAEEPLAGIRCNPASFKMRAAFRTMFHEVMYRHSSNARTEYRNPCASAGRRSESIIAYNGQRLPRSKSRL